MNGDGASVHRIPAAQAPALTGIQKAAPQALAAEDTPLECRDGKQKQTAEHSREDNRPGRTKVDPAQAAGEHPNRPRGRRSRRRRQHPRRPGNGASEAQGLAESEQGAFARAGKDHCRINQARRGGEEAQDATHNRGDGKTRGFRKRHGHKPALEEAIPVHGQPLPAAAPSKETRYRIDVHAGNPTPFPGTGLSPLIRQNRGVSYRHSMNRIRWAEGAWALLVLLAAATMACGLADAFTFLLEPPTGLVGHRLVLLGALGFAGGRREAIDTSRAPVGKGLGGPARGGGWRARPAV